MNWCISLLAFGEKNKKFATIFVKSCHSATVEPPPIVIVTDSESGLESIRSHSRVILRTPPPEALGSLDVTSIRPDGTIRDFDYSLKRLGFREALDAGFTSICLIDADMTVRDWVPEVFTDCFNPGLSAGHLYSAAGFGIKPVSQLSDLKFTSKLAALRKETGFECNWVDFRMPFEAVLFLSESAERIAKFLSSWEELSAIVKRLGLPLSAECHEIALAAGRAGIPIRLNKELLSRVFRHYILKHDQLMRLHEDRRSGI